MNLFFGPHEAKTEEWSKIVNRKLGLFCLSGIPISLSFQNNSETIASFLILATLIYSFTIGNEYYPHIKKSDKNKSWFRRNIGALLKTKYFVFSFTILYLIAIGIVNIEHFQAIRINNILF